MIGAVRAMILCRPVKKAGDLDRVLVWLGAAVVEEKRVDVAGSNFPPRAWRRGARGRSVAIEGDFA